VTNYRRSDSGPSHKASAFAPVANAAFLANHRANNDTGRSGQRLNAAGADGPEDFVGGRPSGRYPATLLGRR
jgi:hypothetical protein